MYGNNTSRVSVSGFEGLENNSYDDLWQKINSKEINEFQLSEMLKVSVTTLRKYMYMPIIGKQYDPNEINRASFTLLVRKALNIELKEFNHYNFDLLEIPERKNVRIVKELPIFDLGSIIQFKKATGEKYPSEMQYEIVWKGNDYFCILPIDSDSPPRLLRIDVMVGNGISRIK